MRRMLLVAITEYKIYIQKKSFLFAAFLMPLFLFGVIFLITMIQSPEVESVGYMDQSGILADQIGIPAHFTAYTSLSALQEAVTNEQIKAYFIVAPDYLDTGNVDIYSDGNAPNSLIASLEAYLLENLTANEDTPYSPEFLQNPVNVQIVLMPSGKELAKGGIIALFVLPVAFMMVFMLATQITGSFLMYSIVEEKKNRIMELLITSISPFQLLMGKLFGFGALGLTQFLVWLVLGLAGFLVMNGASLDELFSQISLPFSLISWALIYFIFSYLFLASAMAAIGVIVGSEEESRQYAGIFSLAAVIPAIFIIQFFEDPNGPLPVILSLIPFTSGIAMIFRLSITDVPLIELLLSVTLLFVSSILITWISAKIFAWAALVNDRISFRSAFKFLVRGSTDKMSTQISEVH